VQKVARIRESKLKVPLSSCLNQKLKIRLDCVSLFRLLGIRMEFRWKSDKYRRGMPEGKIRKEFKDDKH
jgi:hypothetical protein